MACQIVHFDWFGGCGAWKRSLGASSVDESDEVNSRIMIRSIVSHTITAAASASIVAAYFTFSSMLRKDDSQAEIILSDKTTTISTDKMMDLSPNLPIYVYRPNKNLQIAFDARTRNPIYVLEKLDARLKDGPKNNRAGYRFYENTNLPDYFRSRNHQYKNSGFDRGHMAPAADFSYDENAMRDTFSLCNISPQHSSLNRGTWASLEDFTRMVAKEESDLNGCVTYVWSGPLWLPSSFQKVSFDGRLLNDKQPQIKHRFRFSYDAIGDPPSLISVPTHFFKVVAIVDEQSDQIKVRKIAAFVVSNFDGNMIKDGPSKSIGPSLVRIRDLEAVTGVQFALFSDWKDVIDFKTETLSRSIRKSASKELVPFMGSDKGGKRKVNKSKHKADIEHLCSNGRCNKIIR